MDERYRNAALLRQMRGFYNLNPLNMLDVAA